MREEFSSASPHPVSNIITFDNLELDETRHEARLKGEILTLKPKEYELLLFMAQHRGQALSRDNLLDQVWGWDYHGDSRTVDVHIHWLREKIEIQPDKPTRLITVRGAGYRFEG